MKVFILSVLLGLAISDKLPSNTYGVPNGGIGASNGASGNGFGASGNGFGSAANGFGASSNGFGAPNNRYGAPTNGYGQDDEVAALAESIPGGGVPGEDYPILASVPDTGFSCDAQAVQGYYADTAAEAGCQVFHICQDRALRRQQDSFLCPNGTIFNQQYLVCDWWFNVDCSQAESFYSVNELIGVDPDATGYAYGPAANGNGNGANGRQNGNGNGRTNGRNGNGYGSNGNGVNGNGSAGNGNNGYGANGSGINGNGSNGNGRGGYTSNGNGLNGNGNGINGNGNGNGAGVPSQAYGAPF
nr:pro-resilin-like [Penaeus vannamei]